MTTNTLHHWKGVLPSALDAVGHTPLVRLDRIAREEGLSCNLLAKCEFFSAGGSVKDRIAKRMVEHAEKTGRLVPGKSVVIEPTSGNTGIGLALACAIKGYKCIITLPAKMSLEKEVMLKALGAEIVRTPWVVRFDSPESHIGVARALEKAISGAVILDQYSNPDNPLAHYFGTYEEIIYSLETSDLPRKNIVLLAAGAGTGGTVSGIARAIRDSEKTEEHFEHGIENGLEETNMSGQRAVVLAIDPEGSILGGGEVGNYEVEGIGYDFFPEVLDPKPPLIDEWIKTNDKDSFAATKRVIRKEGLFIGGSSGSALSGALRYLHSPSGASIAQDPSANVVILFPDGVRNYISKPWFLEQEAGEGGQELRNQIRNVLGRDLGDVYGTNGKVTSN
ncbi:cystathionine beta-synthase [Cryptococcus wingfieldii CBS 7118]|uniref:cystathionine beta-synthase n=1 Tax=Cryptococcus wingfieldii CBS 7118 TaxID=1295528 RepID=A0A1E3JF75_9TREE|nr:cystathionine beta-synthase [Cryptococcus wingfieldii CBS 7118]ODN99482.1 cystathionine beta-synthase [Cryptococcus wingfieldii CBS 7118]